ncbi:Dyp-type peroxidase [Vibrio ostreicida]|uniref:Dyp-type peroxidase n=1 Tax=Vibrio ostreicida TaxID=526588 RepID=A0ABT8BUI9_9VIBR|nr:Dyp-type peroxidase [Vibrio ostreicida]MDN3610681.1 Dyp-type peroxidase [Vibrio ostreicida]MDN3611249.1 Dyp-type peroxidase [Vibrio ostreicida]NPD07321.1 Dyp-type peroxidase [Vibrio ostreicida]
MITPQSAIIPESGPFAQYTLLKVSQNRAAVLEQLKRLPQLVEDINQRHPDAGMKLSIAFTLSFWKHLGGNVPPELIAFPPLGEGDTQALASDADVLIHCHSNRHDLHFYVLSQLLEKTADYLNVIDETYGYRYLDSRDMTGFVDGTENPKGDQRQQVAIVPQGEFSGGSYVMVQRFVHNLPPWNRLNVSAQEKVIGRTKTDSIELSNVPSVSHVGRVDIKEEGKGLKIVRHSLPYGNVTGEHGLLFIAYCNTLHNFKVMLESMYGMTDGKTDHMLRFTKAVTGAYLFAPSVDMLQQLTLK